MRTIENIEAKFKDLVEYYCQVFGLGQPEIEMLMELHYEYLATSVNQIEFNERFDWIIINRKRGE